MAKLSTLHRAKAITHQPLNLSQGRSKLRQFVLNQGRQQRHQHHMGDRASDLLTTIEKQVGIGGSRYFGSAVRLETTHKTPDHIRELLSRNLELDANLTPYQIYTGDGPLGLADLMELTRLDKPALGRF